MKNRSDKPGTIADAILQREGFAYFNNCATNLMLILKNNGTIIHANSFATKMMGSDIIGKNFKSRIVDFTRQFDLSLLVQDEVDEQLMSLETVDGLPRSYYFRFKPVEDHILAFGRQDLQTLESMHRQVLELNQELSNLTRELHKKNADLKRLNTEKNRFIGMASHDLRKPIGLLMTYSGFLVEETGELLNPIHRDFLETIQESSEKMGQLVDDLLDVSAIESGALPLRFETISVETLLTESLRPLTLQATRKNIQLKVSSNDGLQSLVLDAAKIEQVINNLVGNAIEHSSPGMTVELGIKTDDQCLYFFVRDNGPGIPSGEISRLFKPFPKISTEKSAGERNTGLGLLISRKIIEAHGGKIWVESQVGKGSVFQFEIPMTIDLDAAEKEAFPSATGKREGDMVK